MPNTREQAIQLIDGLYPPDCEYENTNEIGRKLLQQAKEETMHWSTNLPDSTIFRYLELCENYSEGK